MSSPLEKLTDWAFAAVENLNNNIVSLGHKIAGWLVIGNAGALVLLSNTLLNYNCNINLLYPVISSFSFGLISAFLSVVLTYFVNLRNLFYLSQLAEYTVARYDADYKATNLIERGFEIEDGSEIDAQIKTATSNIDRLNKKSWVLNLTLAVSIIVYFVPAFFFAKGLLIPTWISPETLQACVPADQSDAINLNTLDNGQEAGIEATSKHESSTDSVENPIAPIGAAKPNSPPSK